MHIQQKTCILFLNRKLTIQIQFELKFSSIQGVDGEVIGFVTTNLLVDNTSLK